VTQLLSASAIQPEASACHSAPGCFHVAIIMDGNGRWAQQRGLPRRVGHYYGAEAARGVVSAASDSGITHLTLFGFSTENWSRPRPEIEFLVGLLRSYLKRDVTLLHENGVRLKVVGDISGFPADIIALSKQAEALTSDNSGLILTIALGFGGRADIVSAVQKLAALAAAGEVDPGTINETAFANALPSAFLPDVDLLIRTSGEQRVSNFILWQLAYAEMIFVDRFWPAFTKDDLLSALARFRQRQRRFGGI
jgi:undecaprenyl diphosphate synthase